MNGEEAKGDDYCQSVVKNVENDLFGNYMTEDQAIVLIRLTESVFRWQSLLESQGTMTRRDFE